MGYVTRAIKKAVRVAETKFAECDACGAEKEITNVLSMPPTGWLEVRRSDRPGVALTFCDVECLVFAAGNGLYVWAPLLHHAFGGSIRVRKVNSEALFEVGDFILVFAVAVPARSSAGLVKVVRDRLNASRQRGPLVSTSLPVLVVSKNHIGPLPSNSAPDDILNPDDPDDLITGPTFTRVRWIDAATLTNVSSLDAARRLVEEAVA